MKKPLLIIIFAFSATLSFGKAASIFSREITSENLIIDNGDTVVFDLLHATINGGFVQFPVYFKSDDIINAVDFSFKYNQVDFVYDTISDLTNYLSSLSYYNAVDSTVRFTSYSLQEITHDTALVSVRFNVLAGTFCSPDINTIIGYLNGDVCSVKVIECISTGIADPGKTDNGILAYPNPASGWLTIEAPENATIELFDINGKQVLRQFMDNPKQQINTQNLDNGVYVLKVYDHQLISVQKILINK